MNSIAPVIEALEAAHAHLNAELFHGALATCPTITLQSKGRKQALGWYAKDRWENGTAKPAELNLSAEDLKRPVNQVLATLLHEMAHQKAHQTGIKDCSRSGLYHNNRFKAIAESAGLTCLPKTKQSGWGHTELSPRGLKAIESIRSKVEPVLTLARIIEPKGSKAKGKMLLWLCPCGVKVRSGRKDISIRCNDCLDDFKLQGQDEEDERTEE